MFVHSAHLLSVFVSFYLLCISTDNQLCSPQILWQFSPGFYLTSQPLFFSQPLYYISISCSDNHVPWFSIQGHSSSSLPSPLLFIISSLGTSSLILLSFSFSFPFSVPPLYLPSSYISHPLPIFSSSTAAPIPYEIVNHLSSCFCYAGSDRNRQANSLKYTWKTRTHSQTHASLICRFPASACIIHS